MNVGKSVPRIDAYDKVTGRAKYTDDLAPRGMLTAKLLHAPFANGLVTSIDASLAMKAPGVVKVVTCFSTPAYYFATAGHPYAIDPDHQDVADRLLLSPRVRRFGDDIAVVIAEDEISAERALKLIKITYIEYPVVIDPVEAMKDGAPIIREAYPNNILDHSEISRGDFDEAIKEDGLIRIEGLYETQAVQHCHIEYPMSYAYMEGGRVVVVAATQIPHIVKRVVANALGLSWGKVRIVKPYIGGGFGNRQDVLYEPLNAYLSMVIGGRAVKLELTREETFYCTRTRHAIKINLISYVRPDGRMIARSCKVISNQGAYASHGHSITSKAMTAFRQLYIEEKAHKVEGYTVYTNTPAAGAMRGYGAPQAMFALESHAEDIARVLNIDEVEFRRMNMIPVGFFDPFTKNTNYFDSLNQCIEKGMEYIKYKEKREQYKNQTGPIRRGIGMAIMWYNTAVWPISLEVSSCRIILNQDGSVQMQMGDTEIGQGADTVFAQMAADELSIPLSDVHVISTQDTDITPFGTGAYASRQTYVGGMAVKKTAGLLKQKILAYAHEMTRMPECMLDIVDENIVLKETGKVLITLAELAMQSYYSLDNASQLTAEATAQCKSNAFSLGCAFAEVEVDIPMCKVTLLDLVNVHDCGRLINPQLARAQGHGGMSMAIGYGLSERLLYNEKTGEQLNGNFLDYKLSTTMDHPHLEALFVENPEPTSPYGTKALGEAPAVPGAPAIRNAVLNATGVAIDELPLCPHVLYPKFVEAGLIKKSLVGGEKNV